MESIKEPEYSPQQLQRAIQIMNRGFLKDNHPSSLNKARYINYNESDSESESFKFPEM